MSTRVARKGEVRIPKKVRKRRRTRPGNTDDAKQTRSRFAALRGTATVRMSTRQIMALTRGED